MKITRIAKNTPDKPKIVERLMEDLVSYFGTGVVRAGGVGLSNYANFEMRDEAEGTCWINVAYIENREIIYIDKYYESEVMNDAYGNNARVPYDNTYEVMRINVINAINKIK